MQGTFQDFAPDWCPVLTAAEIETLTQARHILRRLATQARVITSWDQLTDYLTVALSPHRVESLRAIYLDRRNRLIADEEVARGSISHCPVYPREIVKRALILDASAVIIAHNHPSGDPTPSQADGTMSREIKDALATVDITLHDSVVCGGGDTASLRALGELD